MILNETKYREVSFMFFEIRKLVILDYINYNLLQVLKKYKYLY
jgi:hypothetical protein